MEFPFYFVARKKPQQQGEFIWDSEELLRVRTKERKPKQNEMVDN